jgi:DNA-binding SARP family transcriptional activator
VAIERKFERDIDLLLAEEFAVSPRFATWFLKQTKNFAGLEANVLDVYASRSESFVASK